MEDESKKSKSQLTEEDAKLARQFSATIRNMVHEETDVQVSDWSDGRTKVPVSEYLVALSRGLMGRIDQLVGNMARVEENLTAKLAAVESRLIKLEKQAPKEEESKKD